MGDRKRKLTRRIQTLEEWKNGRMEYWNIGFKKLNKICPPSLERFAREKKSYVIASRPPGPHCAGLPLLGYFDNCFTTETQRPQSVCWFFAGSREPDWAKGHGPSGGVA